MKGISLDEKISLGIIFLLFNLSLFISKQTCSKVLLFITTCSIISKLLIIINNYHCLHI